MARKSRWIRHSCTSHQAFLEVTPPRREEQRIGPGWPAGPHLPHVCGHTGPPGSQGRLPLPGPWLGPTGDLRGSRLSPPSATSPPSAGPDAPFLLGSPLWGDGPGRRRHRPALSAPGGRGGLVRSPGAPRSQDPESWECWRPWLGPPYWEWLEKLLRGGGGWGWTEQRQE